MHPKKLLMVYVPNGPLPNAINANPVDANVVSVGTLVPLTFKPLVVSTLVTTCANFSIGMLEMFLICCILALKAPAAVAISGGNIPSK